MSRHPRQPWPLVAIALFTCLLSLALRHPSGHAQAPAAAPEVLAVVGGSVQAVVVEGQRAYVGIGSRIRVLDIGGGGEPRRLGESAQLPGLIEGLAVADGRVLAAARAAGLRLADLRDPAAPRLLGGGPKAKLARAVQVAGGFGYLADGSNGVRVLDLADAAAPAEVAVLDVSGGEAWDLALSGGKAFVADRVGLKVFDVSNPRAPTLIGGRETPGWARDVVVTATHAFAADGDRGLIVMDLKDLADISRVADLDTAGDAMALALDGSRLYIADGSGLRIVDVADPETPALLGSLDLPGEVQDLALSGSRVWLAAGTAGLLMVDAADPAQPRLALSLPEAPLMANAAAVAGGRLYVADGNLGLLDFALDAGGLAGAHGRLALPGTPAELELAGNRALVAARTGGLQVVDLSRPGVPRAAVKLEPAGRRVNDVALADGQAAMLDAPAGGGKHGLHLLDLADGAEPRIQGSSLTLSLAYDLALSGDRAYVADLDGLRLFDIADRSAPKELGQADPIGVVYGLAVDAARQRVIASVGESGLRVLDASDPARRRVVGSMDTAGYFRDLLLVDGLLFVADKDFGLRILTVGPNDQLSERAAIPLTGTVEQVAVAGPLAYVSLGSAGLAVVRWKEGAAVQTPTPTSKPEPTRGVEGGGRKVWLPWLGREAR